MGQVLSGLILALASTWSPAHVRACVRTVFVVRLRCLHEVPSESLRSSRGRGTGYVRGPLSE